jgi:AAA domain-containing protein
MTVDSDRGERFRAAALAQPGAMERVSGIIKFQCPACRREGHDRHQDNAGLFPEGAFGCAWAADGELARAHWSAIGEVLGAFHRRNGSLPGAGNGERDSESAADKPPEVQIKSATLDEILAVDPCELMTTYIAEPYVPHGLVALSARWGTGKTKLLQDLCLARASGGLWLGLHVEPGPALFWSGEQGRREDLRTTQALCRGRRIVSPADCPHHFEVLYDPPVRFGEPRMLTTVMLKVRQHPGLLVCVDSLRRAFEGDEIDSELADRFFSTVLQPLREMGATVCMLAHPPKTSGTLKRIEDENYIRGSGDWPAQLDSFLVLRFHSRTRLDPRTENITLRLTHPKARGGGLGEPRLVTLHVTADNTPHVAFRFDATDAPPLRATPAAEETAGAVKTAALLFEKRKRASRSGLIEELATQNYGRPAVEAAIAKLLELGVIRGPLDKDERLKGERGHWFVFLRPPPTAAAPENGNGPDASEEREGDSDDF